MERIISLDEFPHVSQLFGKHNCNIKLIRERFNVSIVARDTIKLYGEETELDKISQIIASIKEHIIKSGTINSKEVEKIISKHSFPSKNNHREELPVAARTPGQKHYIEAILDKDVVFAIGPAGTGKTYLAVAMAVDALKKSLIRKIILVRPAIEAGEKLGFLPGDFQAKINPYLRPLHDALYSLLSYEKVKRYMEKGIIEIVPLAYMRGRTLENAFIILDEGQNATAMQMKMFLTRLGLHSKIVVTGDITQVDLPAGQYSGLRQCKNILHGIVGVEFIYLTSQDIVRHRLVQKIVEAYEKMDSSKQQKNGDKNGDKNSNKNKPINNENSDN